MLAPKVFASLLPVSAKGQTNSFAHALADLRRAPGTPPGDQNSFNFMQFLGKNWPNNSLF